MVPVSPKFDGYANKVRLNAAAAIKLSCYIVVDSVFEHCAVFVVALQMPI